MHHSKDGPDVFRDAEPSHSQQSYTHLGLLGALSLVLSLVAALYTRNGWPFDRPSALNCAVRLWHTSVQRAPTWSSPLPDGRRALKLSPSVLLDANWSAADAGRIPRLLHQSWKTSSVPERFDAWVDSWRRLHPDWSHVLWTDEDNLELMRRFYPQYLDAYLALPSEIYRADMIRNCYLHRFGGIYADLDVEALRPLDALLDRPGFASHRFAYAARMHTSEDPGAMMNAVPNAFMASAAGHDFWLQPLDYVVEHLNQHLEQPEWLTGSLAFRGAHRTC